MNKERYENGRKEWDNNFAISSRSGQVYSMCGDGYKARKDSIAARTKDRKGSTRKVSTSSSRIPTHSRDELITESSNGGRNGQIDCEKFAKNPHVEVRYG